jgi:hypothetical protein
MLEKSLFRPSFDRLCAVESHASRMCVESWFLGSVLFSLERRFLAFESGLFQLLKVNRELAYFIPFAK